MSLANVGVSNVSLPSFENLNAKINWQKTDGLIPAIVQNKSTGQVLMLGYMNQESLRLTLESRHVTFFSRTRQTLWTKGESSGHFLDLLSIQLDCDQDTLLVQAKPHGPTCHLGTNSCFSEEIQFENEIGFLNELAQVIDTRFAKPEADKSYVASLIQRGTDRMIQKVGEEAVEVAIAAKNQDLNLFEGEVADLLFHVLVLLRAKGSSLKNITGILKERNNKAK